MARPVVSVVHANEVEQRRRLATRANAGLMKDGSNSMRQPLTLKAYVVADAPDPTLWENSIIYVPDESGGAVIAFSDGQNWRRSTDRAVIS